MPTQIPLIGAEVRTIDSSPKFKMLPQPGEPYSPIEFNVRPEVLSMPGIDETLLNMYGWLSDLLMHIPGRRLFPELEFTPCSVIGTYQQIGDACCCHYVVDGWVERQLKGLANLGVIKIKARGKLREVIFTWVPLEKLGKPTPKERMMYA